MYSSQGLLMMCSLKTICYSLNDRPSFPTEQSIIRIQLWALASMSLGNCLCGQVKYDINAERDMLGKIRGQNVPMHLIPLSD